MKKPIIIQRVAFVMFLCIMITSNVFAFADTKQYSGTFLSYKDVASYIKVANRIEDRVVLDNTVRYYYGDNFIVVEEPSGYSLVTKEENGNLFVNGKYIETTHHNSAAPKSITSMTTTAYDWVYFDTDNIDISIGGLTVAVVTVLIEDQIPSIPSTTRTKIITAISAYLVGQIFPPIYIFTYETLEYVRVEDPFLGTMSWKYVHDVYCGPENDERAHNPYGWTTYNYNTV